MLITLNLQLPIAFAFMLERSVCCSRAWALALVHNLLLFLFFFPLALLLHSFVLSPLLLHIEWLISMNKEADLWAPVDVCVCVCALFAQYIIMHIKKKNANETKTTTETNDEEKHTYTYLTQTR